MSSQVGSRKLWSNPHDLSETEAYTPSVIDRFMGLIQRLPRVEWAATRVDKEQRCLPRLAPLLSLAVSVPPATGTPAG